MENAKIKNSKWNKVIILLVGLTVAIVMFNAYKAKLTTEEISYNEFLDLLDEGAVSKVVIMDDSLEITLKNNNKQYGGKILYTPKICDDNLISELRDANVYFIGRNKTESPIISFIVSLIFPIVIICLLGKYISIKKG